MSESSAYFLGDHGDELTRLGFQAKAWRDITVALCVKAGIGKGHQVVDLGCGPGFFTFDLASMVGPEGHVLAVDKSDDFLAAVRNRMDKERFDNVSVLRHDLERARLPYDTFDFVFVRWLDPYVDDLDNLIENELACLKPGGRTISLGTFNYQGVCMAPWSDDFDLVTKKIIEFYENNGQQISAGNLAPAILCAHGASIIGLENVSQLAQPGEELWEWYRQFSFSMLPRLLEADLLKRCEADAYVSLWGERAQTPGAFINVPSHVGIIAEKRAQ